MSANQLALNLGIHPHTVRHWIQEYNDGKLKADNCLVDEKRGVPLQISCGQQEAFKRPDIEMIISKIGLLESELKELKSILQKY